MHTCSPQSTWNSFGIVERTLFNTGLPCHEVAALITHTTPSLCSSPTFFVEKMRLVYSCLLAIVPSVFAATAWQQREYNNTVPVTPLSTIGNANFTSKSDALSALGKALSNATIAYPGDMQYGTSLGRIWTENRKIFPEAILFPKTPEDVSIILQFYSGVHALWTDGFAILGGGHADIGGGQTPSVVIDLREIGSTEIVEEPASGSDEWAVLKIGGGSEAGSVYSALDGTGWAFLGPRAASIGVGGFLLGGGIAFQTNRYGVAVDSLLGIEVVLIDGKIVYANPYNEYSDLFWAATGGGWLGFGVVTHFYVQAYPDPGEVFVGTIVWGEDKSAEVFNKTAAWFESNTDADAFPALLYYFKDPSNPGALVPILERQFTFQLNAIYFGGSWAKFNESFSSFYEKADSVSLQTFSIKTLDQYLLTNYPYGYNRLFYGKSHTNSTIEFYEKTFASYQETINGLMRRGEDPGHTLWVDECE